MNIRTIRPTVSPDTISKVTRLFNGTADDIICELLQNARRAGAKNVEIDIDTNGEAAVLIVSDDGCGIPYPDDALTLGTSGWDEGIAKREDAAGMGVFSLAGKAATITSKADSHNGWSVSIPADGWEGDFDLPVEACEREIGTSITIIFENRHPEAIADAVRKAARFYPLTVSIDGEELDREDFLKEALFIAERDGCRIGVYPGSTYYRTPCYNFHGLVIDRKASEVSEGMGSRCYHTRVDIIDAPELKLVLPARKEFVQNEQLLNLDDACFKTIFEYIQQRGPHRLSFEDHEKAAGLGIQLDEAERTLRSWLPAVRDEHSSFAGDEIAIDSSTVLVHDFEAYMAQGLARALDKADHGFQLADMHSAYEGYSWYDALPRLDNPRAVVDTDELQHTITETEQAPDGNAIVECSAISFEIDLVGRGDPQTFGFASDLAFDADDGWRWTDELRIFIAKDGDLTVETLADLIEKACFEASDDGDADCYDTQHERFVETAMALAREALLDADEALCGRIREKLLELKYLIPKGKKIDVVMTQDGATVEIDQISEAA